MQAPDVQEDYETSSAKLCNVNFSNVLFSEKRQNLMRSKMQFSNPFLCKKLLSFSFVLHNSLCAHFKSGNDYKSPCQRNAHIDLWFWEKSKQNHQVLRTEKLDATTSKLVKLFLSRKYLQRPNLKFTHPASRGTKLHH